MFVCCSYLRYGWGYRKDKTQIWMPLKGTKRKDEKMNKQDEDLEVYNTAYSEGVKDGFAAKDRRLKEGGEQLIEMKVEESNRKKGLYTLIPLYI